MPRHWGTPCSPFLPRDQQRATLGASERVKLSERTLIDLDELLDRLDPGAGARYATSDGENAYGLRTVAARCSIRTGFRRRRQPDHPRRPQWRWTPLSAIAVPEVRRVADELTRAVRLSFGAIAQTNRHGAVG